MFNNDLNRIRSGFIAGAIAALIFALPSGLFAQSSPLTVQPSTGRVGVGTTAPTRTLTVQGTAIVGQRKRGKRGRESFSEYSDAVDR
jgi:hypothetical protein